MSERIQEVYTLVENIQRSVNATKQPDSQSLQQLFTATTAMQEMNRSFSIQYLAIQQKIQQENREFNLLSNVMKARHEAAKNAINNLR